MLRLWRNLEVVWESAGMLLVVFIAGPAVVLLLAALLWMVVG